MVRRARELNAEQRTLVSAVKRVARQRARVNASYVDAILTARDAGVTYAAIAEAVGTSSQAVQEIVRRHRAGRAAEAGGEDASHASGGSGLAGGVAAVTGMTTGVISLSGEQSAVSGVSPVAL
ncbi:hypothetical protein [Brevibacterium sp.]|uniref:hypothetical protein n=1 Tax=Brevibacterium sp. TaxID=1701 RepID=UPI0025C061D2|nr:hypothetical protein [Brevibacterium sp.]